MSNAPSDRRLTRIAAGLAVLALLAVSVALLLPGREGPGRVPHLDKLWHFLGFFGIVLPAAVAFPRAAWALALAAAAYGGAVELVQPMVGRGAEWLDAAANLAGALVGAVLGRRLRARLAGRPLSPAAGGTAGSSRSPSSAGLR